MVPDRARRPIHFMASSLTDLCGMPDVVRGAFGRQLLDAQYGDTPASAKPLKGFGGANVLELVEDDRSSTYRAVYTVRFERAVYVLHVFQKKSTKGIATSKGDLDMVRRRLQQAQRHYDRHDGRIETPKESRNA
jgi:phage-related protein